MFPDDSSIIHHIFRAETTTEAMFGLSCGLRASKTPNRTRSSEAMEITQENSQMSLL